MTEKPKKQTKKNLHEGHRERVREKFLKSGMEDMEPHVALEFLLFYSIPRGDTNPIAHALIDRFGSFSAVFDAPYEELLEVSGVGPSSAVLIKMIPEICRRYVVDQEKGGVRVYSSEEALKLLRPRFLGRRKEAIAILLLDSRGKATFCDIIGEGSVGAVPIYANRLVTLAARYNAVTAVMAHNHPSGRAMPSAGDIAATRQLIWALEPLNVTLYDHLIITDTDCLSMASSGIMSQLYAEHTQRRETLLHPESGRMVSDLPFLGLELGPEEEDDEENSEPGG